MSEEATVPLSEDVREAIAFVGLEDYEKFRPRKLSGGLLRRLNISCGIAHKPELIFFDEPTVAVDPQSRNAILEGIQNMNRQGSTVVYTSHYMEEVEEICTRIMIMDHGQALATGTNAELKAMIGTGEKKPRWRAWTRCPMSPARSTAKARWNWLARTARTT